MFVLNLPRRANMNMKNKSNISTSMIGFKDFNMSRISLYFFKSQLSLDLWYTGSNYTDLRTPSMRRLSMKKIGLRARVTCMWYSCRARTVMASSSIAIRMSIWKVCLSNWMSTPHWGVSLAYINYGCFWGNKFPWSNPNQL